MCANRMRAASYKPSSKMRSPTLCRQMDTMSKKGRSLRRWTQGFCCANLAAEMTKAHIGSEYMSNLDRYASGVVICSWADNAHCYQMMQQSRYGKAWTADLQVGLVGAGDELFQRAQLLGFSIGIHQLCVYLAVLGLLTHHDQVLHQILIATSLQEQHMDAGCCSLMGAFTCRDGTKGRNVIRMFQGKRWDYTSSSCSKRPN